MANITDTNAIRFCNTRARPLADQVAKLYQGIIIAPYCYSIRLDNDCFWYYPWDCASGCIWDATAIAALVPVQDTVCAK